MAGWGKTLGSFPYYGSLAELISKALQVVCDVTASQKSGQHSLHCLGEGGQNPEAAPNADTPTFQSSAAAPGFLPGPAWAS